MWGPGWSLQADPNFLDEVLKLVKKGNIKHTKMISLGCKNYQWKSLVKGMLPQMLKLTLIWGLIFNLSKNVMYFEKLFWNIPQRISCTLWENISRTFYTECHVLCKNCLKDCLRQNECLFKMCKKGCFEAKWLPWIVWNRSRFDLKM